MRDDTVAAPDHRLHNSGPGAREVFRCARVGKESEIDLLGALGGARCLREELRALQRAMHAPETVLLDGPDRARIPAGSAAAIAGRLLRQLGREPEPDGAANEAERATVAVRQLVREVIGRDLHRTLIGLATESPVRWGADAWTGPRVGRGTHSAEDVARAFAAFAVFTPPLLLWSRPATLDWLRLDVTLSVRPLWASRGGS